MCFIIGIPYFFAQARPFITANMSDNYESLGLFNRNILTLSRYGHFDVDGRQPRMDAQNGIELDACNFI